VKRIRRLLPALLLVLGAAAQARELDLSAALELAERHAYSLKKATATHEASLAGLAAARADRFPTLSANGLASYTDYVAQMRIAIPAAGVNLTRDIGAHERYQSDLRISVPLYTGGRISGNIALAGATEEMNAAILVAGRDQLAYLTRLEYLALARADRQLLVAQASLKRAETIDRDVQSLHAAGAADSVALLEASLVRNRATFAVQQATTARRASELRLLTYLGLEPAETVVLTDSIPAPTELSAEPSVNPDKPELQAARAVVKAGESRLRLSKADYFPTIAAFGGYSYGKPNLDQFNNTWNDYFTVGATLNWSFNFGRKTRANARAAGYALEAARFDREQTAENLGREARLAAEQVKLTYQRYMSAREEQRIAAGNYRLAGAQHRDGTLSSNRLVTIEQDLTAAQSSLASAQIDYQIALSTLYYATGSENLRKGI